MGYTLSKGFALLLLVVVLGAGTSAAAVPVYSPATGSYYDYVRVQLTWSQASAAAQANAYLGIQGRLATITSADENAFIVSSVLPQTDQVFANQYWIGGIQPEGSVEPDGGWSWITGEPFIYTNWEPGEPNNNFQGQNENRIEMYAQPSGTWNDLAGEGPLLPVGYLIEYAPTGTSVPEPGAVAGLAMAAWVLTLRRRCV